MSECVRVDFVGFDLGVGNGFEILGVCHDELDAMCFEQITEPVPTSGDSTTVMCGPSRAAK